MNLSGQPAELQATIHITRKATGLTETYHITGRTTVEEMHALGVPEKRQPVVHDSFGALEPEQGHVIVKEIP
jgi:hypothetical protein